MGREFIIENCKFLSVAGILTAECLGELEHIKGSIERYLLGQKHNLHISGLIPCIKLQNDT